MDYCSYGCDYSCIHDKYWLKFGLWLWGCTLPTELTSQQGARHFVIIETYPYIMNSNVIYSNSRYEPFYSVMLITVMIHLFFNLPAVQICIWLSHTVYTVFTVILVFRTGSSFLVVVLCLCYSLNLVRQNVC